LQAAARAWLPAIAPDGVLPGRTRA